MDNEKIISVYKKLNLKKGGAGWARMRELELQRDIHDLKYLNISSKIRKIMEKNLRENVKSGKFA